MRFSASSITAVLMSILLLCPGQAAPSGKTVPGSGSKATFTPASAGQPIADKWAVVIGVSKFADPKVPTLKYAAKDATDFYSYLVNPAQGNFQKDHVKLLTNDQATVVNIMDMLGDSFLPHAANPDDLVVIYLSTHGSPAGADIRGVNYVLAYDTQVRRLFATGIEMRRLIRIIKERVKTNRIVLVLDTCYSGAGTGEHKGLVRTNVDSAGLAQGMGSLVITSSSPQQQSWESDTLKNSYFTHYFLESLKSRPQGVTIDEAFNSMKQRVQQAVVSEKGEMQTPVMAGNFSGPRLVLGLKPGSPRPAPITYAIGEASAGDQGKAAGSDLAMYGEFMREARKFIGDNKFWDAGHALVEALKKNEASVEAQLLSADVYDQQGRYDEEFGAARKAVRNDPESSQAREKLARAYLRLKQPDDALREAQKAVTLDPENSMAHYWLARVNDVSFKRWDLAEQEYRKALDLNGLNGPALLGMAQLLDRQSKEGDQIEGLVRKALDADGDDPEAHLVLARILLKKGDSADAEKHLHKAIQFDPNNPVLHSELGNSLASNPTAAETEFRKGLELGKEVGFCHFAFARYLADQLGRLDEAEKEYRLAIKLDPEIDEAYVRLGNILLNKKVYDESDALFKKAIVVNPRNADAMVGLARIKSELFKDYPGAEAELKKAINLRPNMSSAHDALGLLYDKCMNRKFDAKKAYEKAIEVDSKNAEAHYHLAMLLLSDNKTKNSPSAAFTHVQTAVVLAPKTSLYQTRLGELMIAQKRYKDAEGTFRKAIEINTADSEAHLRLGLLLIEKLGQRKAGEVELRTALSQNPNDPQIKAACERFAH